MAQPTASQDYEVSPIHGAVDQRRRQWRAHYDWLKAFTHVPPSTAYAGLVLTAIEMRKLFHDYLAQPQAPQSWMELKRSAPGAFEIWVIHTDVYQACALALASPEARGKDDSAHMVDAINGMLRAMVSTPAWLCGANMNLGSWNAAVSLSGWAVANISLEKKHIGYVIDVYRESHLVDMLSCYGILCHEVFGVIQDAWRGQWRTLRKLRTEIAKAVEHIVKRQNDEEKFATHALDAEILPALDDSAHRIELCDLFEETFRQAGVTKKQEDTFRLSFCEGYSYREIAQTQGRSEDAIKQDILELRKKMKPHREDVMRLLRK